MGLVLRTICVFFAKYFLNGQLFGVHAVQVQFISLPKHCVQVRCRPGVLKYGVVGLAEVKENAWIR